MFDEYECSLFDAFDYKLIKTLVILHHGGILSTFAEVQACKCKKVLIVHLGIREMPYLNQINRHNWSWEQSTLNHHIGCVFGSGGPY